VIDMIGAILAALAVFFRSRLDLSLEVLALRHQIVVLKRKTPATGSEATRSALLGHAEEHVAAMVRYGSVAK
jgi:hypothetical protein